MSDPFYVRVRGTDGKRGVVGLRGRHRRRAHNNPGLATVGAAAAHPRGTAEGSDVMSEMELHPSAASRPTGRDEGWGYSSESVGQDS